MNLADLNLRPGMTGEEVERLAREDYERRAARQALENQIGVIQSELHRVGYSVASMSPEGIVARNAELTRLEGERDRLKRELAALPDSPPLPQDTGEAAGSLTLTRGGFLGDRPTVPPREEPHDPDADHPMLREYGEAIK
jgi:uncharacterized protein (DUF3084 family)